MLTSPFVETSEGPEIAVGMGMTAPAALIAPVSVVSTTPASNVPTVPVSATPVAPIPGNFGNFPSLFISSSFSASLLFSCHFFFSFYLAFPLFF